MTYKQYLHSLVLACIMGMLLNSELYAVETHYYKVIINNSVRQVTVVISTPATFDNSVTVRTDVEGVGSLTYSYTPVDDSTTGYVLSVVEPPLHDRFAVQVNGIAANHSLYNYDYPDDLYFWPEDSPAVISPDGHSLQLPVFNILLTGHQLSGDEPSTIFHGHHFSTPEPAGPITQLTTDNNLCLIEINSPNYRMTKSLPRPESDKSDTESESSLDSAPEDSLPGLKLNEFKENRKDKDGDPGCSCPLTSSQ